MDSAERSLSVSEAISRAKRALEGITVSVIGELSELSDNRGYKAVYFVVSDAASTMNCLMWRDAYVASGVTLRCGMLVEMRGHFSVYPAKGRMQFAVRELRLAGEGHLRLIVAERANRLKAEGLMSPEGKRALPAFPSRIGVVTSPHGKAIHDVLRTLERRYPLAEVVFAGVTVEGADAATAIIAGLRAVAEERVDVVLLVRGGGSYEDLMPFNDEELARVVAGCPVPVVTGIGHEPDVSIVDLVADASASTPTAAAEAVSPSIAEIRESVTELSRSLGQALDRSVRDASHRLARLSTRPVFSDRTVVLGRALQAVDQVTAGLGRALAMRFDLDARRVANAREALLRGGTRSMERVEQRVAHAVSRLHDLSPLAVLSRGYAVCHRGNGTSVVRNAIDLQRGDRVRVRVERGTISCVVERVEEGV